ncbi:uncharacterized protein LOC134531891 [Bacillus rossius redtenbacheri]|uniref:uncharacterized protein LOC134531891 n=1 Tax=Bacillus rossius redtenbacheri TaxID=93214 RepID=UPI002FDE527A
MGRRADGGGGEEPAAAPLCRSHEDQLQPPEGGWGWMVVVGMALMFISTTAHYGSFGLLFDGILARLGQQTTGATFIMNALASAVSFTGLVTNHLLRKMSYRMVSLIGALVSTVGLMLTIFADSIGHIVLTYSIVSGIGLGMVAPSSYLAFNTYFLERRALAMGVCQAGIGLGFIVAPPLVQCLLDRYGYRGTLLVLSGISLNGVVGAVLYQPVRRHLVRPRRRPVISEMIDIPLKDNNNGVSLVENNVISMDVVPEEEDHLKRQNGSGDPNCYIHQLSSRDTECDDHTVISRRGSLVMSAMLDCRAHLLLRPVDEDCDPSASSPAAPPPAVQLPGAATRPPSAFVANFASNVLMFDNAIASADAEPEEGGVVVIRRKRQFSQQCDDDLQRQSLLSGDLAARQDGGTHSRRWLRAVTDFLDLGLLGDPVYVNIVLGLSVSFLSDANFFTVFPFFLQSAELGFSAADTAVCMSIAAGADVASRLALPWLAGWLGLRARDTYLLGCFASAVARSVFACVDGFFGVAAMSCVVGLLKGSMVVNQSLTIAEHCSLDRFAAAYSLYMVINGVITVTLGPLVGVVRDRSGSFPLCIHALSLLMLLCVFGWLLEYFVTWYRRHSHNLAHAIKSRLF